MRKNILLIFAFCISVSYAFSQNWTEKQIEEANTAKDISYISQMEKDVIMYINLARLYPQDFARIELKDYYGPAKYGNYLKNSPYKTSLEETLNTMKPVVALQFDQELYESAKCFAKESGEAGITGHTRVKCPKANVAECCSYGMDTAKDVVLQLLIDHNVASLGHRKICLDPSYTKAGASEHPHTKYTTCTVVDIIW